MQDQFQAILARFNRVAIAGGPRVGKSTLSESVTDRLVIGTDAYQDMEWAEIPHAMILDTKDLDRFVVEGVMVARALRKGMAVDAVVYLQRPKVAQLPGQASMAKGVLTIFRQWHAANKHVPVFEEQL